MTTANVHKRIKSDTRKTFNIVCRSYKCLEKIEYNTNI